MAEKESGFRRMVEENRDKLYRVCRFYSKGRDEAADLYQDVLINIWNALDSFRGESMASTWMYRIAVNTAIDFTRREKSRMTMLQKVKMEPSFFMNGSIDTEEKRLQEQRLDTIHQQLNLLPIVDRAIMTLVLENLPGREIAEITGLTEANVRVRIHRVKQLLKDELIQWKENGNES